MRNRRVCCNQQQKKYKTIAGHLRRGALTLSDVLELSERELNAVAQVAESLRRRGKMQEAITIYGMLAMVDPLNHTWWSALAALHHSGGAHGLAVICYETHALLQGRHPEHTRQEIHALNQLGAQELAQELAQRSTKDKE